MPLIASVLGNGLANLAPVNSEAEGIATFASAWQKYFKGASVNGVPISGSIDPALSAMKGAMVGMNSPGAGPQKMQAGIQAFWNVIASSGSSLWILAPAVITPPVTPPPGIGGISSALQSVFASNTASSASLATCAQNVAAVLHSAGGMGGIAIVQPPPTAPPVPTPIL